MNFEPGWLKKRCEEAARIVESWPEWEKNLFRVDAVEEETKDKSECCNASVDWSQSTRYGMTFWCRKCHKIISSDGDYSF